MFIDDYIEIDYMFWFGYWFWRCNLIEIGSHLEL